MKRSLHSIKTLQKHHHPHLTQAKVGTVGQSCPAAHHALPDKLTGRTVSRGRHAAMWAYLMISHAHQECRSPCVGMSRLPAAHQGCCPV